MDDYQDASVNPFAQDYYPPRAAGLQQQQHQQQPATLSVSTPMAIATDLDDDVRAITSVAPTPIAVSTPVAEYTAPTSASAFRAASTKRTSSTSNSGGADPFASSSKGSDPIVEQLRVELRAKERELNEKNAKIASLRTELDNAQRAVQLPNWPWIFPVIYLNFSDIVDQTKRRQVNLVYWLWLYTLICYVWNFFVITIAYLSKAYEQIFDNAYVPMLYWIIIFLTAPLLSFVLWFRTIYTAALASGSVPTTKYWFFFINIMTHFIVTVLCFSGVFFENGGIVTATQFFTRLGADEAWGFVFLSTTFAWAINTIISVMMFVYVLTWYLKAGGGRPSLKDFSIERAPLLNSAPSQSDAAEY